jgi:hypothetical protein
VNGSRTDGELDFARRRERRAIHIEYFGEVLLNQPKTRVLRVPREDDDAFAGNAAQLGQALVAARPVMNR